MFSSTYILFIWKKFCCNNSTEMSLTLVLAQELSLEKEFELMSN